MLFRTVPSSTPYGLPFLEIGGLQFSYPLLSQERVKLRTSNLAGTFTRPIQIKAHEKFGRKWTVGESRDCPHFGYLLLSREPVKLRTSHFVGTFIGRSEQKPMKSVGNSSRERSQVVPKIFRAPMYRAYCAVIFAIAQLSCVRLSLDGVV